MQIKNFSAGLLALFLGYCCHAQNLAPTVSLSAPSNNRIFQLGQTIELSATANDADGSIEKVEFFQDGQKVAEVSDAPFSYSLSFTPPGVYNFTAKAFDNKGASTLSAVVKATVNAPPFVALNSPNNNSIFHGNANLILSARAGDADDLVTKVEFLQNGVKIGEDFSAPYTLTLSNLVPGPYFFAVQAYDSRGGSAVSTPAAVLVNAVPTLSILTPNNNSTHPLNATLNFQVDAKDPDGTVKKVEFYINNVKMAEDSVSPYRYEYTGDLFGTYTFVARALDDLGGIAVSAALEFVINAPPLVSIVNPSTGSKYLPGSVLTLQVNANDVDGEVRKVEFWQNGEKMGEDLDAPFTYIMNNLRSGGYTFAAKAFDNFGLSSTSSPIAVIVNAPPNLSILSPSKDTSILQGSTLPVRLAVSDTDGEIERVEVYLNDIKVGEASRAPYTLTLANLPAGKHQLRARAWDDTGDMKETKALVISVNTPTSTREVSYSDLSFFPNPVHERLYFKGLNRPIRIQIYDAIGRMVQEVITSTEVDLRALSPGKYWMVAEGQRRALLVKL